MQNGETKSTQWRPSRREFCQIGMGIWLAGLAPCSRAKAADPPRAIKRSDIFFSQPHYDFFRTGIYEPYGVDWTAWGFLPLIRGQTNMAGYLKAIERHRQAGIGFQARVEWDAVRNGMPVFAPENEEAAIRDLDGNIITVPWFGGEPWFCSHQPLFQSYLRYQIDLAFSGVDDGRSPDSLMFDCQTATPLTYHYGGCFCERCVEDFRVWLQMRSERGLPISGETLELASFDYREYLRSSGYTLESYNDSVKRWPAVIPLSEEYRLFQLHFLQALIQQLVDYAEKRYGDDFSFSASAPLTHAPRLIHNEAFSHYTLEANHHADKRKPADGMFTHYKLADAIKRPLVLTALPNPDWLTMAIEGRPNLARSWIAQAYASGAIFMVPIEQWAYRGSSHLWYRSRPSEYASIYQFIQQRENLFDNYEAATRIALLYVHTAYRKDNRVFDAAVRSLTRASLPFHLWIAGDEWWPFPEDMEDNLDFVKLLTTSDVVSVNSNQRDHLLSLGEKVQSLTDFRNNSEWDDWRIHLDRTNVIALPRRHALDPNAPVVCHLLNRNYSVDDEQFSWLGNFTVRIPRNIYGKVIHHAVLHAPGNESQELQINRRLESSEITIPELHYWALLELQ